MRRRGPHRTGSKAYHAWDDLNLTKSQIPKKKLQRVKKRKRKPFESSVRTSYIKLEVFCVYFTGWAPRTKSHRHFLGKRYRFFHKASKRPMQLILISVWLCLGSVVTCFGFVTRGVFPHSAIRHVVNAPKLLLTGVGRGKALPAKVEEILDDGPEPKSAANSSSSGPTDEELGKTNGYEGKFNVGNVVRVVKPIKIWSVKPYTKEGFDANGIVGKVSSLVLYGRKLKSLCSAITPVKVEFTPDDPSLISKGFAFERKFTLHFNAEELELIE